MVWGGRAVAVAAMVGYEAAAASVGRLLADSISLLGHEAGAASPPRTSYFDAAFPRQAAFEPMTLHQFFARSELVSRRERGVFPRHEKTVIGNLREVAERLAPGRACIPVVPDHGFAKTGASLNLFPAFPNAGPPDSGSREVAAGPRARCVRFFVDEVLLDGVRNPLFRAAVRDHSPGFHAFRRPAGGCSRNSRRRFRRQEFPIPVGRNASRIAFALHDAWQTRAQRGGPRHKRRSDSPRHRRRGKPILAARFCGRIVWTGPTSGRHAILHCSSGRHRPWEILEAERWTARALPAVRLRRHGGGALPAAHGGAGGESPAASFWHVDGLHAFFFVGRNVSRFPGCADADGVPTGADCGAEPCVAENGDGRDSQRSGMEERGLLRGAAAGAADGARPAPDRGERAALHAEDFADARRRGQISG